MPLILGTNSIKDTGYNVDNSCRFNDGDGAYMHKSPGSSGNQRKFTFSTWFKIGNSTANLTLFATGADGSNRFWIMRHNESSNNSQIKIDAKTSDSQTIELRTNASFRDSTAWMHLVVAVDTEQGTAANRVKVYINGTQITSFNQSTYPAEDHDTEVNKAAEHRIGRYNAGTNYFDGYLAETVFIDGTQYAASDFGEFDEDSPRIWKPKDVSGLTFGSNGFYLDYKDSSNLGNDANGGTDLTEVNLAATDQSIDTCTNNFATMNSLANKVSGVGFSEGNLNIAMTNNKGGSTSTFGLTTGKWYVEMNITTQPADERFHLGINPFEIQEQDDHNSTLNQGIGLSGFNAVIYADSGSGAAVLNNFFGNNTTRFDSFTGIIGMALDITDGTIAFSKAGAWVTGSGTTDTDFSNALKVDISTALARHDVWHITCGSGNSSGTTGVFSMNFGSPSFAISSGNADGNGYGNFEYAVPSGYFSLCTKNLAEYGG